jgi:hypothetical protein
LRLWLRKQFARRRRAFPALIRLAERFGPCPRWQRCRRTDPPNRAAPLRPRIRGGTPLATSRPALLVASRRSGTTARADD